MHIYLLKVRYMISYTLPAVPNATALSLTPTSCPTPLPKAAPRPPPPPKVTWRPLWTPHPLIQTLLHFHFQSYHGCEIACIRTPRVS